MEVREFADPREFRAVADPLILANEAADSLLIGISGILVSRPEVYPEFRLWCAIEDGEPHLAAVMTPPRNVILSASRSDEGIAAMADALASIDPSPPGLTGTEPTASRSVERMGITAVKEMGQGIHELKRVIPTPQVPGQVRRAGLRDSDLLVDWMRLFALEALPRGEEQFLRQVVDQRMTADTSVSGFWLWECAGTVVSASGYGRPTPTGITVGPVFTPVEHRGKGYATSLVAELSGWLLDSGRRSCFLYTDLANPTSNAIYRRIGYRLVAESSQYRFVV